MSCQNFVLQQCLAASSARSCGGLRGEAVGTDGVDCNHLKARIGVVCPGPETSRPFSASTRRKSDIFLVGSACDLTVIECDGRANPEIAIWSVGSFDSLASICNQMMLCLGELFIALAYHWGYYLKFFHFGLLLGVYWCKFTTL